MGSDRTKEFNDKSTLADLVDAMQNILGDYSNRVKFDKIRILSRELDIYWDSGDTHLDIHIKNGGKDD